jgi:hypothetical protein
MLTKWRYRLGTPVSCLLLLAIVSAWLWLPFFIPDADQTLHDNYGRLYLGMSEADVQAILGPPTETISSHTECWGKHGSAQIFIEFDEQRKVKEPVYVSRAEQSLHNNYGKLYRGMSETEVQSILGPPTETVSSHMEQWGERRRAHILIEFDEEGKVKTKQYFDSWVPQGPEWQ